MGTPPQSSHPGAAGVESTTVAEYGERRLLAAIAEVCADHGPRGAAPLVGVGDDAAVLAATSRPTVACCDTLVEGRHFRREWSSPEDIGRRGVAASTADVEAMGGRLTGVLSAVTLPADTSVADALALATGIAREAARHDAPVLGGDLTRGEKIVVTVTTLGVVDDPLRLSTARPGDRLAISSAPGWSAAGLALLEAGIREGRTRAQRQALATYRVPTVVPGTGERAAEAGARALTDVSDGLLAELDTMARTGGLVVEVDDPREWGPEGAVTGMVPAAGSGRGVATTGESDLALDESGPLEPGESNPCDGETGQGGDGTEDGTTFERLRAVAADLVSNIDESDPVGAGESEPPATTPDTLACAWMLTGGEDHCLLGAFPEGTPVPAGWPVIGRIVAWDAPTVGGTVRGPGVDFLVPTTARGWQTFSPLASLPWAP